jgi:ATP-dependent Lon protease
MRIPLHIFEERYKELMQYAIDHSGQFGLSYKDDASIGQETLPEISSVGCAAKISTVFPLEEGRMNILSLGLIRYRVIEFTQTTPFLVARIETFQDDDVETEGDISLLFEDTKEITLQFLSTLQSLNDASLQASVELPNDPEALSLIISSALPLENEGKQSLLEITSTKLRLTRLRHYLVSSMTDLEKRVGKHDGAKRNGHNKWRT